MSFSCILVLFFITSIKKMLVVLMPHGSSLNLIDVSGWRTNVSPAVTLRCLKTPVALLCLIHSYQRVCMCVYIYLYNIHTCVCMYMCIYIYICICMYVCVCIYTYTHIYTHIHMYIFQAGNYKLELLKCK